MAQSDLLQLVRSTSLSDLQSMIAAREKIEGLLEKKSSLLKDISAIDQEITSIEKSLARSASKALAPGGRKRSSATRRKRSRGRRGKRASQPSMQSLIAEILREKGRPLSVNEIADTLLNERSYKTTSKNFKHQLRVMLSLNKKGLFKKLGSGMYASAAESTPAGDERALKPEAVAKDGVVPEKKTAAAPKKKSATKKTSGTDKKRPAPAKPKSVKK